MNLQRKGNAANDSGPSCNPNLRGWADDYLTERYDPPALSLDEHGMIQDCSKTFEKLVGFQRSDLVWNHISRLFPQLVDVELLKGGRVNPLLNYLCHCGHSYQVQNRQGETLLSNLSFVLVEFSGRLSLRMIVHASDGVGY